MLTGMLIGGLLLLCLVIIITSREGIVPWVDDLTRLNPGVANRGEWMAPPATTEMVKQQYLEFYEYAAYSLPKGWVAYQRELDHYLADQMLDNQRASLEARLHYDRGRVVDVLRATHQVQVRHFSADGLRCIVIDHQSEPRMATYEYWSGRRLHTQALGDAIYVYQMRYDQHAARWKIARFIQTLPPMTRPLDLHLPQSVGRDN